MDYTLEGQEVSRGRLDYAVVLETVDSTEIRFETCFQISTGDTASVEVDPDRPAETGIPVVSLLHQQIAMALNEGRPRTCNEAPCRTNSS